MTILLGYTHAAGGALAAAGVLAAMGAPPSHWPSGLLLGALAGLLPDIDHPGSIISHHDPVTGAIRSRTLEALLLVISAGAAVGHWLRPGLVPASAWRLGLAVLIAHVTVRLALRRWIHHRVQTHCLLAGATVAVLLWRYAPELPAAIRWATVAGYLSHSVPLDLWTPEGVALFWPFWSGRISLARLIPAPVTFSTGSVQERLLVRPGLLAATAWLVWVKVLVRAIG